MLFWSHNLRFTIYQDMYGYEKIFFYCCSHRQVFFFRKVQVYQFKARIYKVNTRPEVGKNINFFSNNTFQSQYDLFQVSW